MAISHYSWLLSKTAVYFRRHAERLDIPSNDFNRAEGLMPVVCSGHKKTEFLAPYFLESLTDIPFIKFDVIAVSFPIDWRRLIVMRKSLEYHNWTKCWPQEFAIFYIMRKEQINCTKSLYRKSLLFTIHHLKQDYQPTGSINISKFIFPNKTFNPVYKILKHLK